MKRYSIILAVISLVTFGCTTSSRAVFFEKNLTRATPFALGALSFEGYYAYEGMKDESRSLQISAATVAGLDLADGDSVSRDYTVNVLYRDVELIKGFRRIHSLSVVMTVWDSSDNLVANLYISEEGDKPLESMSTYLRLTKKIWSTLARKLRKR